MVSTFMLQVTYLIKCLSYLKRVEVNYGDRQVNYQRSPILGYPLPLSQCQVDIANCLCIVLQGDLVFLATVS